MKAVSLEYIHSHLDQCFVVYLYCFGPQVHISAPDINLTVPDSVYW